MITESDAVASGDCNATVDAATARADAMRLTDARAGVVVADEAAALARAHGYRLGEARALRAGAVCRSRLLDVQRALEHATTAATIFAQLGEGRERAATLNAIGRLHLQRGDCAEAARFHVAALELQRDLLDTAGEAETRTALGAVHFAAGEIAPAIDQFRVSHDLFEALGDTRGVMMAMMDIGSALGSAGQVREGLAYHERALDYALHCSNVEHAAIAHNNIGYGHARLGDRDTALMHYQTSLTLARSAGNVEGEVAFLENIGLLKSDAGDIEGALAIFRQVADMSDESQLRVHQAEAKLRTGELLARVGQYDSALITLHAALDLNGETGARQQLGDIHHALVAVHEALDEPALALRHFKLFYDVREELRGADAERRVLSVMIQSEVREKEREATLLRERNAALDAANQEKARLLAQLEEQAAELDRLGRVMEY